MVQLMLISPRTPIVLNDGFPMAIDQIVINDGTAGIPVFPMPCKP
jgi:hypothetical protein